MLLFLTVMRNHIPHRPSSMFPPPPEGNWARWFHRILWAVRGMYYDVSRRMEVPLRKLREKEHIFFVVAAILLGVLAAYGAIGFRFLIMWFQKFFSHGQGDVFFFLAGVPPVAVVLIPALGGLLVGVVVHKLSPEVKGSGIPEVMEAVAQKGGAIRLRVVLTKAFAAAVTIGSGGSAGREGPIVHIGSAIGSVMGQALQVSVKNLRTFIACGTAAAIAATFNAPIAGALFAIEVVLGDMRVASMSPIVIASVVATVISRHYLGDFPAFEVPSFTLVSYRELFLYAAVGVISGIVSVVFIRLMYFSSSRFDMFSIPDWVKPALGGAVVGCIALVFPCVLGVGYETINHSLNGVEVSVAGLSGWSALLAILLAKMVATSLTLGSGGSGGVFAPSLYVGAALGAAFGIVVNALFPQWTAPPSAYALVGMGAVVSATTHAPITAILIIFELTNNYKIIPPLMLACVIGVLLSSYIKADSIYTEKLSRRGIQLGKGRDLNLLKSIEVRSVMESQIQKVSPNTPVATLFQLLTGGQRPNAIVVDDQQHYIGTVELPDVREVLHERDELAFVVVAADVADRTTPSVTPTDHLDHVMQLFGKTHRDELPVCASKEDSTVVGAVTRKAVIDSYNARIFAEDMTDGLASRVALAKGNDIVEMIPGVHVSEIDVPSRWVGRKLKHLSLRRDAGLDVLLIQRNSVVEVTSSMESSLVEQIHPDADFVFHHGDRVLVMGSHEAISAILM